jgi:hypothetical protein
MNGRSISALGRRFQPTGVQARESAAGIGDFSRLAMTAALGVDGQLAAGGHIARAATAAQ